MGGDIGLFYCTLTLVIRYFVTVRFAVLMHYVVVYHSKMSNIITAALWVSQFIR